jgi:hypothetical protein
MFFVTGSGTNMGKMAVNSFYQKRKWCKCWKNGGKRCFL